MIPIRISGWRFCLLMGVGLAGALTGCGKPAMVGLITEHPPVVRKWYSLVAEFTEVDSLTPTFRWQPFNTARIAPSTSKQSAPVDHVHYEIRIWRTVTDHSGKLVYAREQLAGTTHRLERPLAPGTCYYWSVRAHFNVNGRHRVTEWALAGYPLRSETVPSEACLRFKTPLVEKTE